MKFLLFALFAAAAVLSTQATLEDDFNDIAKLIPLPKFKAIVAKHAMLDKEFQDFIKFVKTDEFSKLWDELLASPEFREVVTYVQGSGYDMSAGLNKLAALLDLSKYPTGKIVIMPRTVNSFLRELLQALPKAEISALMKQKMESRAEWKKFITHLSQPEFKQVIDKAMSAQSTANIRGVLAKKGLNLKKIIDGAMEILEWSH